MKITLVKKLLPHKAKARVTPPEPIHFTREEIGLIHLIALACELDHNPCEQLERRDYPVLHNLREVAQHKLERMDPL